VVTPTSTRASKHEPWASPSLFRRFNAPLTSTVASCSPLGTVVELERAPDGTPGLFPFPSPPRARWSAKEGRSLRRSLTPSATWAGHRAGPFLFGRPELDIHEKSLGRAEAPSSRFRCVPKRGFRDAPKLGRLRLTNAYPNSAESWGQHAPQGSKRPGARHRRGRTSGAASRVVRSRPPDRRIAALTTAGLRRRHVITQVSCWLLSGRINHRSSSSNSPR